MNRKVTNVARILWDLLTTTGCFNCKRFLLPFICHLLSYLTIIDLAYLNQWSKYNNSWLNRNVTNETVILYDSLTTTDCFNCKKLALSFINYLVYYLTFINLTCLNQWSKYNSWFKWLMQMKSSHLLVPSHCFNCKRDTLSLSLSLSLFYQLFGLFIIIM